MSDEGETEAGEDRTPDDGDRRAAGDEETPERDVEAEVETGNGESDASAAAEGPEATRDGEESDRDGDRGDDERGGGDDRDDDDRGGGDRGDEAAALRERVTALESELTEREERVEELEDEVEDLTDRLRRTRADYENYKKRAERKRERVKERATEDLVERLLDVRDNLRRATEEDDPDAESLLDGVEMTLREFDRVLDDEGVTEIAPAPGEAIDPQRHEVMMRADSEQPEDTVAEVYAPGYEMADEVVRPARVTVSTGPADGETADEESDGEEAGAARTEE